MSYRKLVLNNWLLNTTGMPNSWVELDLVQEHNNLYTKVLVQFHALDLDPDPNTLTGTIQGPWIQRIMGLALKDLSCQCRASTSLQQSEFQIRNGRGGQAC